MWNKNVNKALNIAIVGLVISIVSMASLDAYGGPGRGFRKGPGMGGHFGFIHHLNRMQFTLGLSDRQVTKIFNIHQEYQKKMFENRRNLVLIEKLATQHYQAVRNVLTKEQQTRFDEMRNFRRGPCMRQGRRGRFQGDGPRRGPRY